jgi:hypothetical protein
MVTIVIHDLCESTALDSETMCNINGGILIVKDPQLPPGNGVPDLPFPIGDYRPKPPFPYPGGDFVPASPEEPLDPGFSPPDKIVPL